MRRLIGLPLAALVVAAGCGSTHKMSAEQTARWIERHAAAGVDATCRPGSDGWDYTCTLTGGRVNESTYGYKVNDRGVTDFSF